MITSGWPFGSRTVAALHHFPEFLGNPEGDLLTHLIHEHGRDSLADVA